MPFVIAECLARPVLTERLVGDLSAPDNKDALRLYPQRRSAKRVDGNDCCKWPYTLPRIAQGNPSCTNDNWASTSVTNAPDGRIYHSAVWTGSEMIVWGGETLSLRSQHWRKIQSQHRQLDGHQHHQRADARGRHTAVWTGSEMIVWGGRDASSRL